MTLIPFGLRDGKSIHISEVDRGLDCDCICTECKQTLVAKKGVNRKHHFAHYSFTNMPECSGGIETAAHFYAKEIIAKAGYLNVPAYSVTLPKPDQDLILYLPSKQLTFTRVEIEERVVFGNRRVDVVGYTQNDSRLLIKFM